MTSIPALTLLRLVEARRVAVPVHVLCSTPRWPPFTCSSKSRQRTIWNRLLTFSVMRAGSCTGRTVRRGPASAPTSSSRAAAVFAPCRRNSSSRRRVSIRTPCLAICPSSARSFPSSSLHRLPQRPVPAAALSPLQGLRLLDSCSIRASSRRGALLVARQDLGCPSAALAPPAPAAARPAAPSWSRAISASSCPANDLPAPASSFFCRLSARMSSSACCLLARKRSSRLPQHRPLQGRRQVGQDPPHGRPWRSPPATSFPQPLSCSSARRIVSPRAGASRSPGRRRAASLRFSCRSSYYQPAIAVTGRTLPPVGSPPAPAPGPSAPSARRCQLRSASPPAGSRG